MHARLVPPSEWPALLQAVDARYRGRMVTVEQIDTDLVIIDPDPGACVHLEARLLRSIAFDVDSRRINLVLSDARRSSRTYFVPEISRLRVNESRIGQMEALEIDSIGGLRTTIRLQQVPQLVAV